MHWRHCDAVRRAQDGDVLGLCLLIKSLERLFLSGPKAVVNLSSPGLIVFTFERGRYGLTQLIDRFDHILGERLGATTRHANSIRSIEVVEVVDVDPIVNRRRFLVLLLQIGLNGGCLAGRCWPQHKDIKVVGVHAGAELNRFQRAILTDQSGDRLQLGGRREAERCRVDSPTQLFNREGGMIGRFDRRNSRPFRSARFIVGSVSRAIEEHVQFFPHDIPVDISWASSLKATAFADIIGAARAY